MSDIKYKAGDIVIAHNGKRPAQVTYAYNNVTTYGNTGYVNAKYLHNGTSVRFDCSRIKIYEENDVADSKTLYSLTREDGTIVYGVHVGTNSQNKFLIEVKGTNEIILADKAQLEEVVPYTFKVRITGRDQHFQGEPGKFKKGDVLIYTGNGADKVEIAMVTAVDTKNKGATGTFKGIKVLTEEL